MASNSDRDMLTWGACAGSVPVSPIAHTVEDTCRRMHTVAHSASYNWHRGEVSRWGDLFSGSAKIANKIFKKKFMFLRLEDWNLLP